MNERMSQAPRRTRVALFSVLKNLVYVALVASLMAA